MLRLENILVATDFSVCSQTALTYGRALARQFGAHLHVLHAVELPVSDATGAISHVGLTPELQTALEDAERGRLTDSVSVDAGGTLEVTTAVRTRSTPALAIVEYAQSETIDLLVLGTHGRHGLTRLVMGSVAEQVVRTAPCPVLTVRDPEREFVVADPATFITASAPNARDTAPRPQAPRAGPAGRSGASPGTKPAARAGPRRDGDPGRLGAREASDGGPHASGQAGSVSARSSDKSAPDRPIRPQGPDTVDSVVDGGSEAPLVSVAAP
jgi:nucleotide-binding universal stress UspA family protein